MYSSNDRIKALVESGEPLIDKKLQYHRSCYIQFDKETTEASKQNPIEIMSVYHHHKYAFDSICKYVEYQIIECKQPALLSMLLRYYKAEFIENGGAKEDISTYFPQNLQRKIVEKYAERVCISFVNQRMGNMIYSTDISEDTARSKFKTEDCLTQNECIISVALYLRSQILELPKSKTPYPTTVEALRKVFT